MTDVQNYEKLGAFYLGKLYDLAAGKVRDELLLYDAKDLTTHAVCVGMTGSGKTGLCLTLLEEAAIDGIGVIAIDPKGDVGNLCLAFPDLAPGDFEPWIDEGEAQRKGRTVAEHAAKTAALWRDGLGQWAQDGARVARFRNAADVAIYTPGSNAGLQVTVLRSFAAPPAEMLEDADALRERVLSAVSGLLALLGIDADPIRSREHILLSNLLERAWRDGRDLGIADLIREIQKPPFQRVGVLDLESFYPEKDRFGLAMTLNNLLASPGFAPWLEGEPLDVARLLWTPEGRPRISIMSIAHLPEAQRMFFVTILLNEVIAWMRSQPGTSSLRALLYMDEVFGFFPPTANPPAKTPMLTLLKQARAYGLGCVLATQNPVDLDYKGLSNAGTWFLGRLQTERDKLRVLEGLEGASAAAGSQFDRGRMEATLAGLGSRVFLMNNVHEDQPALFQTRWALSYLRGPLTRAQIGTLMKDRKASTTAPAPRQAAAAAPPPAPAEVETAAAQRPMLPPEIAQVTAAVRGALRAGDRLVYRGELLGTADLHYVSKRDGLDAWREVTLRAPLTDEGDVWERAEPVPDGGLEFAGEPDPRGSFADLPASATRKTSARKWESELKNHLYRTQELAVWWCKALDATSKPGESEGDFRVRLAHAAREARDKAVAELRNDYAPKLKRLDERIRSAGQKVEREKSQYRAQKTQTVISFGATLLGALFGRKAASAGNVGRATTTLRGASRAAREHGDVQRAEEDVAALQREVEDLEKEFEQRAAEVQASHAIDAIEVESSAVAPRKSDISIERIALLWCPWRVGADGRSEPLFGSGLSA
jgi:phage host-nuclease inhibitor protein Gam